MNGDHMQIGLEDLETVKRLAERGESVAADSVAAVATEALRLYWQAEDSLNGWNDRMTEEHRRTTYTQPTRAQPHLDEEEGACVMVGGKLLGLSDALALARSILEAADEAVGQEREVHRLTAQTLATSRMGRSTDE